jgi:type I restriction enzyme S subunit
MSILEAQLPTNWTWQQVSDLYRVTKKPRDIQFQDCDVIPFVPMELVPVNGKENLSVEMRAPALIASGTYFEKGDILLSKITPSFENGKQGMANELPAPFGIASTEVIPLQRTTPEVNSRLLFYYLLHPEVRALIAGKMEGSTGRQRVPDRVVLDFPLPNPPREEQDKITAVLWRVQRAIEIEGKLILTARELKQAAMHQLFTHGLRGEAQQETEIGPMPESWQMVRLGDVCSLSTGTTPSTKNPSYYNGEVPFIKTFEVVNNRITKASNFVSREAVSEYNLRIYPPGTVLMAMYGQGKTRGQVSLLEISAATTQNAAAIEPGDRISGEFLWQYLLSIYDRLRGLGSLGHLSHLNLGYMRELAVVCPPRGEQDEIVVILNAIDRKISLHSQKYESLQELFKTLLHKLMTGEIRVADLDIDVSEVTQ